MGRKALSIGINDYTAKPLRLCVNDATAMHNALQRMGFDCQLVTNCDIDGFHRATRTFLSSLEPGDLAVFYFAGHGTEASVLQAGKHRSSNWLLARELPPDNAHLPRCAIDAHSLLAEMDGRGTKFNAFILDCCRDDPLPSGYRSQGGGLARMDPKGSIVAFACQPGEKAVEMPGDAHAVFTEHLLKHIETPGLEINKLFIRVGNAVRAATRGLPVVQKPYINHALEVEDACLVPADAERDAQQKRKAVDDAEALVRQERKVVLAANAGGPSCAAGTSAMRSVSAGGSTSSSLGSAVPANQMDTSSSLPVLTPLKLKNRIKKWAESDDISKSALQQCYKALGNKGKRDKETLISELFSGYEETVKFLRLPGPIPDKKLALIYRANRDMPPPPVDGTDRAAMVDELSGWLLDKGEEVEESKEEEEEEEEEESGGAGEEDEESEEEGDEELAG